LRPPRSPLFPYTTLFRSMMKSGSRNGPSLRLGRFEANGSLHDIQRPRARLFEYPPEVFAEYADHHELHAAEHENGEHDRGPAQHVGAEHEFVDQNVRAEEKAQG